MTSRAISCSTNRFLLWLAIVGTFGAACAVSEAPSGGPEDRTPPGVTGTVPAMGSTGVDAGATIAIAFTEPIQQNGFIRQVEISPRVQISRIRWKGNTAEVELREPLHPDTTYVVRVKPGYRDRRNVANPKGFEFAFATSAQLDTGRVDGTVYYRREPSKGAVVGAFVLPVDSGFTPETFPADRVAATGDGGTYTLRYLPARNNRMILWAYEDANGNNRFDAASEHSAVFPDTVLLTGQMQTLSSRDIYIIDPGEPGVVRGRVVNETGIDTMEVSVGLYAGADSLPPVYLTRCDTTGVFEFPSVKSGAYGLVAFMDFFADSLCGTYPCGPDSASLCIEPCIALIDSVRLDPGAEVNIPVFAIEAPGEEN